MVVPETKPVSQMLEQFRHERSHMALVVDEFGTIVGLLTVEDVLEQIVGSIEDEHDEKMERQTMEAPDVELEGTTRIRDLESEYGLEIPADAGFETLAGFLLFRLGEIPLTGQSVEYDGRRYSVLQAVSAPAPWRSGYAPFPKPNTAVRRTPPIGLSGESRPAGTAGSRPAFRSPRRQESQCRIRFRGHGYA